MKLNNREISFSTTVLATSLMAIAGYHQSFEEKERKEPAIIDRIAMVSEGIVQRDKNTIIFHSQNGNTTTFQWTETEPTCIVFGDNGGLIIEPRGNQRLFFISHTKNDEKRTVQEEISNIDIAISILRERIAER